MKQFYPIRIVLDSVDYHCIWYSNEQDGVITANDKIIAFTSLDELQLYIQEHYAALETLEVAIYYLNTIAAWVKHPQPQDINCVLLLDAWNLFIDVSASLQIKLEENQKINKKLYDKLFWGCNLPSMSPPGEEYIPIFTQKECKRLAGILDRGLVILKENITFIW